MDKTDLLWAYYVEQRDSARAFDSQWASIANFVITVTGALIGFSAMLGFSKASIMVYGFIAVLGAYGMAATRKLAETSSFCMGRARESLHRLRGADEDVLGGLTEAALAEQRHLFPLMSRVRLPVVWMVLHVLILLFGIAGVCISVIHVVL